MISKNYYIACDVCTHSEQLFSMTQFACVVEARKEGWFVSSKKSVCQNCQKEKKK